MMVCVQPESRTNDFFETMFIASLLIEGIALQSEPEKTYYTYICMYIYIYIRLCVVCGVCHNFIASQLIELRE